MAPNPSNSPKVSALQNLARQLPVASSRLATQQKAAQDMKIQAAVAAASAATPITKVAQQTGAAAATARGAQLIENATQQVQQQGQVGTLALGQQTQDAQSNLAGQQSQMREQQISNVDRLAGIDAGLKKQLFDENMQFQRDELGRTVFNDRQLSDYARLSAQNEQQFQNYSQSATLASQRNIQLLETAQKKLLQDLEFKYQQAKQAGDNETQRAIIEQKNNIDDQIAREKARAANRAAAWGAAGTVLGGAIGAAIGQNAAGAQAGAGAGGALGGLGSALGI